MKRTTAKWPEPTRVKSDGCCVAQCPACAQHGQDAKGEHLWWNPSTGAYACIAYPKDKTHRKRIASLAGRPRRKVGRVVAPSYRPVRLGKPVWNKFKKGA